MDFLTLAKKRYSVRAYTKQKVEKEKLDGEEFRSIMENRETATVDDNGEQTATEDTSKE